MNLQTFVLFFTVSVIPNFCAAANAQALESSVRVGDREAFKTNPLISEQENQVDGLHTNEHTHALETQKSILRHITRKNVARTCQTLAILSFGGALTSAGLRIGLPTCVECTAFEGFDGRNHSVCLTQPAIPLAIGITIWTEFIGGVVLSCIGHALHNRKNHGATHV